MSSYAWNAAPWWSDDQVLNSQRSSTSRTYNIDENRVVVAFDGARAPTTLACATRRRTPASFR
jgi:hypothetical protein